VLKLLLKYLIPSHYSNSYGNWWITTLTAMVIGGSLLLQLW